MYLEYNISVDVMFTWCILHNSHEPSCKIGGSSERHDSLTSMLPWHQLGLIFVHYVLGAISTYGPHWNRTL